MPNLKVSRFYNVNLDVKLLAAVETVRIAKGMTKEGVTVAALRGFLKNNRKPKKAKT